jgi:transcriptional regulator with XRE-family HTH domain
MISKAESALIRTIGSRLRKARELCQPMTIQTAAKMLCIDPGQLRAVETGVDFQNLSLEILPRAAKVYDVSVDYLFGFGSSDDWELCPEAVLAREFGAGTREYCFEELARLGVELMAQQKKLETLTSTVLQLLPAITEVCESLESFQKRNVGFDEMAGGNQLLYRVKKVRQFGNIAKRRLIRTKILPFAEMPSVE